jgi:hypothetical protein
MKSGQSMADGFQLLIGLAEIHVPRMWAESDPNNSDSRVCVSFSQLFFLEIQ